MLRKVIWIVGITIIAAISLGYLTGCGGNDENRENDENTKSAPANLAKLVPYEANTVILIDYGRIIEDEDIEKIIDPEPVMEEMIGLSSDVVSLNELVLFYNLTDFMVNGDGEYFGVIFKGIFEEAELIEYMESEMPIDMSITEYNGYQIYSDPYEPQGFAVLGNDVFILGSIDAVKDVIAVKQEEKSAVSGELLELYDELGDPLIKLIVSLSPELMEGLAGDLDDPQMQIGVSIISDIQKVSLALDKNGETISAEAQLSLSDIESAENLEDILNGLPMMIGYIVQIPEDIDIESLLDKLVINRDDAVLTLSFRITVQEMEDLIEIFGDFSLEGFN